ncbi:Detected protein of confused Function [Hibiscus syriacus]|uniref:Detected protein of confused Function n=1 Tax=Hibiscus syriacus TaxID=106335 RepID=A0A6A3BQ50_HIBSY|nr:Detected protein of confused Function [Hibiscus syriacus]
METPSDFHDQGLGLEGFLDESMVVPVKLVLNNAGEQTINPTYLRYVKQDGSLDSWLLSIVSTNILAQSIKKGSQSMRDYTMTIKEICDLLAICGSPISDIDHIATILTSLPVEYEPTFVAITVSRELFTLENVVSVLIDVESSLDDSSWFPVGANFTRYGTNKISDGQHYKKYRVSKSDNTTGNKYNGRPKQQCQLCGKIGHLVDRPIFVNAFLMLLTVITLLLSRASRDRYFFYYLKHTTYTGSGKPPVLVPPPATALSPQSTTTSPKSESRDRFDKNSDDNRNDNDQNASSSGGSPDDISLQAQLLTELLLGYLPPDHVQWSYELAKKRSEYKQFKEELLMNPVFECYVASQTEMERKLEKSTVRDNDHSESESSGMLSRTHVTHGEHPLSLGERNIWNQFFQDSKIIEQIDRDVKRTHPDMNFFSGNSRLAKSNRDILKDILIVFAKLNPGTRYV